MSGPENNKASARTFYSRRYSPPGLSSAAYPSPAPRRYRKPGSGEYPSADPSCFLSRQRADAVGRELAGLSAFIPPPELHQHDRQHECLNGRSLNSQQASVWINPAIFTAWPIVSGVSITRTSTVPKTPEPFLFLSRQRADAVGRELAGLSAFIPPPELHQHDRLEGNKVRYKA
jgi:hypothetical protein